MKKLLHNKKAQRVLHAILLIAFVVLMIWLNRLDVGEGAIQDMATRFGYIGVFLAAVLSGFNILIPIPIVSFFPFFVESGLMPLMTILVIAVGMTIGDIFGYVIGYSGNKLIDAENKVVKRFLKVQQEKPALIPVILFLYAGFAPAPNELVIIPAGFLRIKFWTVIIPVLVGNFIFNSLVAFGLLSIFS